MTEVNLRGKELFDEALQLINGERQDDYGEPEDSFYFIAKLWTAYLENACCIPSRTFCLINPEDVAKMMILLKVARGNKHDNFVDICGYAALADTMNNETMPDKDSDPTEGA